MEFNYGKLRGRIVERYGTLKAFANTTSCGIDRVSRLLNNKSSFTQDEIIEWCAQLDIDLVEINLYFFVPKVVKSTLL